MRIHAIVFFGIVSFAASVASPILPAESAPGAIVDHPSKLVFRDLEFTPPDAAAHRHVLPSGVVAYVVEDHELPLVDIQVMIRAGKYLDPAGKYGLASATLRLLRTGGTEKQAPEDFDEALAFLAAEVRTGVDDTDASASLNCLTKDVDRVLDLFFEMVRTPRFDEGRLALQKSQDLQEMSRRNDQTSSIESREWERLLRGPGFYSTERETRATVEGITREDIRVFHGRYLHPKNFILAVSGDVVTQDILSKLEAHLRDWPSEGPGPEASPRPPAPQYAPVPGVYLVDKPEVNQGRVSMGELGTVRSNPDYHALVVMNHILGGGGFASRIMSRVRSDEGLAYSAGSRLEFGDYYDGTFRAFFQSKSESVAKAVLMVRDEIRRIRDEDVAPEELEMAVSYSVGIFPRFFATATIVARTFANDELTGMDPGFWKVYREKMQAVTVADVRRVAQRYLHPDKLVVLLVGNVRDILAGRVGDLSGEQALLPLTGEKGLRRIPLPDPMTLEYPAAP